MSLKKYLIKVTIRVLNQVIVVLTQQIQILQNRVLDEIDEMIGGVDTIWNGMGAEEFKHIASQASEQTRNVIRITQDTAQGLDNAHQRIVQADRQAAQHFEDLNNYFQNI